MQAVASHGLGDLFEECSVIAYEQTPEGTVGARFRLEIRSRHAQCFARHLNNHTIGRCLDADERAKAHHSFQTDGGHFDGGAVQHKRNGRDDTAEREIDVIHCSLGLKENSFEIQGDELHARR